ncbi:MAG: DUF4214 domain-containing protein, partial [Candidatus Omnitrophica bacterium]|nr:DUF4214 domain-containing protein [Candidatus Omnitrophota bacterium]
GARTTQPQAFSDQAVTDILNVMDNDSLAAVMNTFLTVTNPLEGKNIHYETETLYNNVTNDRVTTIFAGMDQSQKQELVSNDNFSAALASVLLTQSRSQELTVLWNGLSADRAATIANQLFGIDKSPVDNGPYKYYDLDSVEINRINSLSGILADMDPAKAAALLDGSALTLTNAAKLLVNFPESYADIMTALTALDADRAANIKEVVTYLNTNKNTAGTGALLAYSRPLTTLESEYYSKILGFTPSAIREVLQSNGTTKREFTYGVIHGATDMETLATSTVSADGVETFSREINATVAALTTDDAAKVLNFLGTATAAQVFASGAIAADKSAEILGKLGTAKTATILENAEKTNAIGADVLKVNLGIEPDLSAKSADEAAEYLAGLDPAEAAMKLERMGYEQQIDDYYQTIMGREATAAEKEEWLLKISSNPTQTFAAMQIEEFYHVILGRQSDAAGLANWVSNFNNGMSLEQIKDYFLTCTEFKAKAEQKTEAEYDALLSGTWDGGSRIAEVLASDKVTVAQASGILGAMIDLDTTGSNNQDIAAQALTWEPVDASAAFQGLSAEKAAAVLAGLGTQKAGQVLGSSEMSAEDAGAILAAGSASNSAAVSSVLALLDTTNKGKSDQIRAIIGAVPGKMTSDASAQYLAGLEPAAAQAELVKLTDDEAAAVLASSSLDATSAAKIIKTMAADKAAAYMVSEEMTEEAAIAMLTTLKITDAAKYKEIMAKLALDTADKARVDAITAALATVPDAQKVSATEQTKLQSIFSYTPAFYTKEVLVGTSGAPDSETWKYYDVEGSLIGTRVVSNPGRLTGGGEEAVTIVYDGYKDTYYDRFGTAVATSGSGFGKLSADRAAAVSAVLQGQAVYYKSTNYKYVNSAPYGSTSTLEYYDENFNLLGTQKYSQTNGAGENYGDVFDKTGKKIAEGTPAVAASVASYNCATYSLSTLLAGKSLDEISAALEPYTTNGSTTLLGLEAIADANGLDMEAVKTEFPNLSGTSAAIVHLNSGHYVTLVSSDEAAGTVTYKDNGVLKTMNMADFQSSLSGYALVASSLAGIGIISDAVAAGILGSESDSGESEAAQGLISGPNTTAKMRAMNVSGNEQWSSSNVNGGGINHGLAVSGSTAVTYSVISGTYNALTAVSQDVVKSLVNVGYMISTSLSTSGFTPVTATVSASGIRVVESTSVQAVQLQAAQLGFDAVTVTNAQGVQAVTGVTAKSAVSASMAKALVPRAITADYESKYEHVVTAAELVKAKYGVELNPTDTAGQELLLKTMASQPGSDVKAAVSSSGVTYTVYSRGNIRGPNGRGLINGKTVYSFTYDKNGTVTGGTAEVDEYASGKWSFVGSAGLKPDGTFTISPVVIREQQLKNSVAADDGTDFALSQDGSYVQYLRDDTGSLVGRLTYAFTHDPETNQAVAGEVKQEIYQDSYWVTVKNSTIKEDGSFDFMTELEIQKRSQEARRAAG